MEVKMESKKFSAGSIKIEMIYEDQQMILFYKNEYKYVFHYIKGLRNFDVSVFNLKNTPENFFTERFAVKESFGFFFPKENSFELDCLKFIPVFEKFLELTKNPVRNPTIEKTGIYHIDEKITFVYYPEVDYDYNYFEYNDYTVSSIINMTLDQNNNIWLKIWEEEPLTQYTDKIKLDIGSREFDYGIVCQVTDDEKQTIFNNPESLDSKQIFKTYFHKYVNEKLKDPFIFENDPITQDKELTWEKGSEKELETLIKMFLYSQDNLKQISWPMRILFITGTDYEPMTTTVMANNDYYAEISNHINLLIQMAFDKNKINVSGWSTYENMYTQKKNRLSSYEIEPASISFTIDQPSIHQQMDAKIKLQEWIQTP